ncbi:MAG: hypothetical protein PVG07_08030 [Acidobacteriota bacterium]|jgi:hypothetical protein
MVSIASLWLPIVLSAVAVFVVSALVWMVLPWHRKDFAGLPDEPRTREAMKDTAPGLYTVPYAERADFQSPEHKKKLDEGPVAFLTVMPRGEPSMAKSLVQWFVWSLVVGVVVAYLAGRTLDAGTHYLQVFRVVGTAAWMAYSWAYVQEAIWFGKPWGFVTKQLFDGLLYALVTAGIFGWLWP